jgi:hypothetical protein
MRTPYYCPYCEQTSTRKENVSVHIQRKHQRIHPNLYNPFPDMKLKQSDCNFSRPKKHEPSNLSSPEYGCSHFRSPQYDLSDPVKLFETSRTPLNVLQEIKQWDKMQLAWLLTEIFKLRNFSH